MAAIFVLLLLVCYWKPIALTLSALAILYGLFLQR